LALLPVMISICWFSVVVFGASYTTTSSSLSIHEVYAAAEHCANKCVDKHQEHNRQSDPLLSNLAE
jgi:hypothetical protein